MGQADGLPQRPPWGGDSGGLPSWVPGLLAKGLCLKLGVSEGDCHEMSRAVRSAGETERAQDSGCGSRRRPCSLFLGWAPVQSSQAGES